MFIQRKQTWDCKYNIFNYHLITFVLLCLVFEIIIVYVGQDKYNVPPTLFKYFSFFLGGRPR